MYNLNQENLALTNELRLKFDYDNIHAGPWGIAVCLMYDRDLGYWCTKDHLVITGRKARDFVIALTNHLTACTNTCALLRGRSISEYLLYPGGSLKAIQWPSREFYETRIKMQKLTQGYAEARQKSLATQETHRWYMGR